MLEGGSPRDLAAGGRLRAWSAGCSYGAEAYTLAAICSQALPGAQVRILGTDIDQRMVARAKIGAFSDDDARSAPRPRSSAGSSAPTAAGRPARSCARSPSSRSATCSARPPASSFDLILCRNTVIYFAEPIRDELHARLARALRPGGAS